MRQVATYSRRDASYKRTWRTNADRVEAFEQYLGKELCTDGFSQLVTEEYIYFLRSHPFNRNVAKPKFYKLSTVHAFGSKLSQALTMAARDGYPVHWGFQGVKWPNEDSCAISFTPDEITTLFRLEGISKEAHAVRERAVIGCHLGLRFSDLKKVDADRINKGHYRTRTTKGKAQVVIPIHWHIKEILRRNKGVIPAIPSQQAFSATLKRICKRARIDEMVLYEQTEGLREVRKRVPKYTLVSPHTFRRSLATNMYLAGIAVFRIMLITGHKTEEAFFRYIRIRPQQNAEELSGHPYFTGESTPVRHICPHCGKDTEAA